MGVELQAMETAELLEIISRAKTTTIKRGMPKGANAKYKDFYP